METAKEEKRNPRAVREPRCLSSPNPTLHRPGFAGPRASGVGSTENGLSYISSEVFGVDLLKVLLTSRTPLGNFVGQSMKLHMMDCSHCSSKHLWPCPIPNSVLAPARMLSGRRRARLRLRRVTREHLRAYVASCNWLVNGRPKHFASESCSRLPSAPQRRMLDQLENNLRLWYRQSSALCSDLSRFEQKFSNLENALSELSAACVSLRVSFDPYGRPKQSKAADKEAPGCASKPGKPVRCKVSSNLTTVDLEPSRLKFSHSPLFNAAKFLNDPLIKAGFLNPRHFRLPETSWPKSNKLARVMCSRDKLLDLFKKWDSVQSLHLIEASSSTAKYRCGVFAVFKNAERDRQILIKPHS